MKKRILKGMTVANQFGQQFTVKRTEWACIILSNGLHVPTSQAEADYTIIKEA